MKKASPVYLLFKIFPMIVGMILMVALIVSISVGYKIQQNDWIGFYGAIFGSLLGGYITYIGVFETIKYYERENDKRDEKLLEDNQKSILPHLTAYIESPIRNVEDFNISVHDDFDFFIGIKLRNIGKDSCLNLIWSYTFISNSSQKSSSTQIAISEHNSLVKNEFSSIDVFGINQEECDNILIKVDFCDLEYRRYLQNINVKIIYPDNNGHMIKYSIVSTEPNLLNN